MKYIKLKSVLPDLASTVSPIFWNEADVVEWAFKAMRKIDAFEQYEMYMAHAVVSSYKADLPDDLCKLVLSAYKISGDTTTDLEEIQKDLGVDNDSYYSGFNETGLFLSNYRPLRLERSPFSNQVLCDECENLATHSEHSYRVNPNMTITTSFSDGEVCFSYLRFPVDCDGDYIIPDIEDYIDAVRSYVLSRYWEARWNSGEEGAFNRFDHYSLRWQTLCQKVKGKLKRNNILDLMENIRQMSNRLVPKERDYYTGFSNRREENLEF